MTSFFDQLSFVYARFYFRYMFAQGRRSIWLKVHNYLHNGVQIIPALESLRSGYVSMGKEKDPTAIALKEWVKQLKNGVRLSTVTEGWVGREEQMLIAAGEQSGKLMHSLNSVAKLMVSKSDIIGAIVKGLAYPIFLTILGFGLTYVFAFKIIPSFTMTAHNVQWHGIAVVAIAFCNFAKDYLAFMGIAFISVFVLFFIALPRWDGRARVYLDRFPPFSIYRTLQGSAWLIGTAALVGAGVRNEAAVEQLAKGSSPWLSNRLKACLRGLRAGRDMGVALSMAGHQFPDQQIIIDLGTYAKLSGFDRALAILGEEWLVESVKRIQSQMAVVFAVSIVAVGGLLSLLVGGLIAMQLQLTQSVQTALH